MGMGLCHGGVWGAGKVIVLNKKALSRKPPQASSVAQFVLSVEQSKATTCGLISFSALLGGACLVPYDNTFFFFF